MALRNRLELDTSSNLNPACGRFAVVEQRLVELRYVCRRAAVEVERSGTEIDELVVRSETLCDDGLAGCGNDRGGEEVVHGGEVGRVEQVGAVD